jgi:hypothetical protein
MTIGGRTGRDHRRDFDMPQNFVDRIRPLVGTRPRGEQLFVAALLENGAAARYREWAVGQAARPELAEGLRLCAEREDEVASTVRRRFADEIRQPADLAPLLAAIQKEVAAVFGDSGFEEQAAIQASAERGGEQLWKDLAAEERDPSLRATLLHCASLEAASAGFLETQVVATPRSNR